MRKRLFVFLLLFGFFLRFFGLFFNGNHNFDTYREWGNATRVHGLAKAFVGGYFPVSYLTFALSDYLSEFTPGFWYWPYKAVNLFFEGTILFLLFRLVPQKRFEILFLYWLNPWFLTPGAWAGFWDSFHTFFLLLSVVFLDFLNSQKPRFFLAGLSLGLAVTAKPQGLAAVAILSAYFLVALLMKKRTLRDVLRFAVGFSLLPLLFNFYFFLLARGPLYLFQMYLGMGNLFPTLVSSEINIWHTVTRVGMTLEGRSGPVYSLDARNFPYSLFFSLSYVVFLSLISWLALQVVRSRNLSFPFTRLFAFSLLLLPQILPGTHTYHFYPGSIFLLLFMLLDVNPRLFLWWFVSIVVHFINIWIGYGLGRDIVIPFMISPEPLLTVLGIIQFVATIQIVRIFLSLPRVTSSFDRSAGKK